MRQFKTVSQLIAACAVPLPLLWVQQTAQAATYNWTGAAGTNWHNANSWAPRGIPSGKDSAIINSGLVEVRQDAVVGNLSLGSNAQLQNSGRLTVSRRTSARGLVTGRGEINIPAGASALFNITEAAVRNAAANGRGTTSTLTLAAVKNRGVLRATVGASSRLKFGSLENSGTVAIASAGQVAFGSIKNVGLLRLTASRASGRSLGIGGAATGVGLSRESALAAEGEAPVVLGDVVNDRGGQVFLDGSGGNGAEFQARSLENQGQMVLNNAATIVNAGISNEPGGVLSVQGDTAITPGVGARPRLENEGTVRKAGAQTSEIAVEWVNKGLLSLDAGTLRMSEPAGKDTTQVSGRTTLNGGDLQVVNADDGPGLLSLQGGFLDGGGEIEGNVLNSATVAPGHSPAIITINGNYTQTTNGTLGMEIGGIYPGSGYDQLRVYGTASLAGILNMLRWSTFVPNVGQSFRLLSFYAVVGDFQTKNLVTPVATYTITRTTLDYVARCASRSGSTASRGTQPATGARIAMTSAP